MKRLAVAVAVLLCLAPVFAAEDFTGKWSGSFLQGRPDGSSSNETIFLDLKHKGAELTGTGGPTAALQWPISKGKVDGNKVTFEVQSGGSADAGPVIAFTLTYAAGHLKGDASAERNGQKLTGKIDVERHKTF